MRIAKLKRPEQTKARLPIFAVSELMPIGEKLRLDDGQCMKIVRKLSSEEVRILSLELYNTVMSDRPENIPLFWVECKPFDH